MLYSSSVYSCLDDIKMRIRKGMQYLIGIGNTRDGSYKEGRINKRQYKILIYILKGMDVKMKSSKSSETSPEDTTPDTNATTQQIINVVKEYEQRRNTS